MQRQNGYTVKREFLGKFTTAECVKKIIRSHREYNDKKKAG